MMPYLNQMLPRLTRKVFFRFAFNFIGKVKPMRMKFKILKKVPNTNPLAMGL